MQFTNNQHLNREFFCPRCKEVVEQSWFVIKHEFIGAPILQETRSLERIADITPDRGDDSEFINWSFDISICYWCKNYIIWINKHPLYRNPSAIPRPHGSMPDHIKQVYDEARNVFFTSHKAANILLRLAFKELFQYMGEGKLTICNSDKKSINLDTSISHILKSLKVLGEESHFGSCFNDKEVMEIDEVTLIMFDLVNLIVEDKIYIVQKTNELNKKLTLLMCK
ncbi:hypothetical protein [Bacillus sp. NH11B]|uniref:hypothetical protein n=1 Tax=Bacillus sp. NH11B TaxID=1866314 RepID=UPI0008FDA3B7|nr:hypothetical protein [Bacillus sp. NH11B]OJD60904.1 hypothetical protein BAU27_13475 [Bacillus sp. NH11B]